MRFAYTTRVRVQRCTAYQFEPNTRDCFRRTWWRTWLFHGRYTSSMFDISRLGRDFVLHLRRSHHIRFCSATIGTLRLRGETTCRPFLIRRSTFTFDTRVYRTFETLSTFLNFYTKFRFNFAICNLKLIISTKIRKI